ncbi:ABC transporter substrate-binding protein [Microbacterium sp. USTB-Y]|uniref:ABC transporter substrate-binding protein n=1 Tax=Microbacterium sp. USTB-Y TaxID=2823692 RepID=UPI002040D3F7|nr:ABC transporter substrate-binding protein [Microbacterium sp. USTB-Y]
MKRHTRLRIGAIAALSVTAVVLAGCSGGSDTTVAATAPDHLSGTVTLWEFFSDREAGVVQSVIDDFHKKYPDVKVDVRTGQEDDKIIKAIAAGNDLDVAISGAVDNVGAFCSSGALRDLTPYIERDGVDLSQLSDVARSYTSFDGKQCALPMLADVQGLYYNTDLLQAAGYSAPPKTLGELEAMAVKLTTYNTDGSIKTLGFNPLMGAYENAPTVFGAAAGAEWMKDGKSAIASSPAWKELMTWQKKFIDEIGYDKLKAFTAGLGDEFSAGQAFQTGQLAMNLDGEWRVAFLADQAPDVKYGVAPFPVLDGHEDLYGGGFSSGTIAGVSKGSKNPEAAWALLRYLTLDTDAVVKLANGLKNVPTTKDALASSKLDLPEQFGTFLDIAKSPHLTSIPATVIGSANQVALSGYWTRFQSGGGGDIDAGLKKVDKDIDDQLALSEGP